MEGTLRKRTVFVRKRTVCAGRDGAEKSPHPNIGTQVGVKMFRAEQYNLAVAALTLPRP
jgi:hypothetical protein